MLSHNKIMQTIIMLFVLVSVCNAQLISKHYHPANVTYLINYSPAVLNGGFESLDGTNDFSNWSEGHGGTSTVTDETGSPISGSHSVRLTGDGSNSDTHILQYFAGQLTGKTIHWSLKAKGSVGAEIRISSDDNSTACYITVTGSPVTYSGTFVAQDDFIEITRQTLTSMYVIIDEVQIYVTP